MGPEMLAYPFLFISIFFESFVLVTLLSKPARVARARVKAPEHALPEVSIIVPCYNEAATVLGTCESLLALDYPKQKLSIVLVDDGSTDETPSAMARFASHPQITIIHKKNGGKHTALNAGIAASKAEIIGCLDADSFVEPDALKEIIACFEKPEAAAATAAMSVHKPTNMLQYMQHMEYIFGIALRHSLASVNGLYVTPGPFSLYRRSVVLALGGFRDGHQTEDLEMALRIQKAGYHIENAPRARVYTKAPSTVAKLVKQRTRWTTGFLRNVFNEYRGLVGNRRYGALGTFVLPIGLLSIMSGILLFGIALFTLVNRVFTAYQTRAGIPLSYVFQWPSATLDWFFLPLSTYLLLALTTISAGITLIIIGKRISNTPGSLLRGIISYIFLYGLVAPFWLMRATADVALSRKRSWR